MSSEWLDLDCFLLATSSIIGGILYLIGRIDEKALENLQNVPSVVGEGSLVSLTKDKSNLDYVAIRGTVKQMTPKVIKSESGVNGVLQVIQINEHSMRRYASGFWNDSVREISHTVNEVPFGLQMVGSSSVVVEIVDPLRANLLDLLSPVSTNFAPTNKGFGSTVFGLLAGNASSGIETTENLLPLDSNVTAIGQLTFNSGKFQLSTPMDKSSFPYIISSSPVQHIIDKMLSQRRGVKILAWTFYGITVFFAARKGWKLWKIYEEKQMRDRIIRERRDRMAASRSTQNPGTPNTGPDINHCIICFTNPREVILLPCGHFVVCADCLERLNRLCPICRSTVSSTNAVYIS